MNNLPVDLNWITHQSLHPDNTQPESIRYIVDRFHNKTNGIPDDFNWIAYRSLNADLSHIVSYKDAVKHYKGHGRRQNRPYKFHSQSHLPPLIEKNNEIEYNFVKSGASLDQLKEFNEVTHVYMNRVNQIPEDFDWLAYRSLNLDLTQIKSYQDAVKHYKEHGYRENRCYRHKNIKNDCSISISSNQNSDSHSSSQDNLPSDRDLTQIAPIAQVPSDFDWMTYIKLNPDLKHINSLSDAKKHYCDQGKRDNRPYKSSIKDCSEHKKSVDNDIKSSMNSMIESEQSLIDHLPKDFDWIAYKSLNPDLSHIKSPQDAAKHYRDHGYRESRHYNYNYGVGKPKPDLSHVQEPLETHTSKPKSKSQSPPKKPPPKQSTHGIPSDFNWLEYRSLHPDLKYISKPHEAVQHYCEHGKREGREYRVVGGSNGGGSGSVGVSGQSLNPIPSSGTIYAPPKSSLQARMAQKNQVKSGSTPRIISTNKPSSGLIPNIIHFVYGFEKQTKDFELFKYIAIKSAIEVNHPDKVYFHYKYEPHGSWWEKIRPFLTLEYVEPPNEIFGNKLTKYAHQSDVVRLKILNERGGIYLDIDTICLRPLKELMKYDFVMGIQGNDYGLCNAIMMAKPETEFGKQWFLAYKSFNQANWDDHSVILPLKLSRHYPITILANDAFFYPLWDPIEKIVFNDQLNPDEYRKIFSNSYCLHLWESWSLTTLKKINEKNIFQYHSLYNIIARKFIKNTFSIVMLTYDRTHKTIKCIESFYKALDRDDIEEFIILDNHSQEPELLKFLKKLSKINKKIRVIFSEENLGVCGGRIKLFQEAKGSLIVSVDSDLSLIDSKFFDLIKDYMYDESIGMLGSSGAFFPKSFTFGSHQDVVDSETNMKIDGLAGCCQVFRNDVKYFNVALDVNYGKFWVEDADFSFQIRHIGKTLLLIPQKGLVDHTWGGSGRQFADLFEKNWHYFTSKWKQYDYLCSI